MARQNEECEEKNEHCYIGEPCLACRLGDDLSLMREQQAELLERCRIYKEAIRAMVAASVDHKGVVCRSYPVEPGRSISVECNVATGELRIEEVTLRPA